MERLTKTEEPIMQVIWRKGHVFVNDIIAELPDTKPPYNTISSIVRILEDKGLVGHEAFGRTHRYHPLITQNEYRKSLLRLVISGYFDGSYTQLMSHIMEDQPLSADEQKELTDYIKAHFT